MDLTSESKQQDKGEAREAVKKANEALAQELADSMRREWAPLVDNLQKAEDAFDGFDMNDLADDSSAAFDLSRGVWREGGWQELDSLRSKLQAGLSLEFLAPPHAHTLQPRRRRRN